MTTKEFLQIGFWTLVARFLGAGTMFLMTIFFARWLGVSDFGLFSLGLTVLFILGVVARWGMDQVLLKQVGSHWEFEPCVAKGYVIGAIKLILFISVIFMLLIATFHKEIAISLFNKAEFSEVLFWFGLMTVPFSLNYTLAEAYKGAGKPILSAYLQNVITPFVAILIATTLYFSAQYNLILIIQSFGIGIVVTLLFSILLWKRIFIQIKNTKIALKDIFNEGWPMLLISSGALVIVWSAMIILGIFGSSKELGVYSSASRVVLLTSLILTSVNSITAPRYANLYKKGDLEGLKNLAQKSSRVLLFLVLFPSTFLFAFPELVMSWFGEEFISGATILMILTVGQFINVASGSVGYILSMTGKERKVRDIMLITAVINIFISVTLVVDFGMYGVALATAISVSIWNIWAMIEVRKHLGFWMFSFKN